MPFLNWLESTALANAVGGSLLATASLSAIHVLGFTLVMSGAVIFNLRASGALLAGVPLTSVAKPAARLLTAGLILSLFTGFALFAPRASYTATGGAFQLKMALLLVATIYQIAQFTLVSRQPQGVGPALRMRGIVGLVLWLALAVTACWFILFE